MHDEPTRGRPLRDPDRTHMLVMQALLGGGHPWPWSVRELALELEDQLHDELLVPDAVVALQAAGLIHRIGAFVWPTRAAARMHEIDVA
jgi:hypothetical protein